MPPLSLYRLSKDGLSLDPYLFNRRPSIQLQPRSALTAGYFFPNAATTGIYTPKSSLTVVTGDVSWGAEHDNITISNTRFTGHVKLACKNLKFKNCWFEGYTAGSTIASVFISDARNSGIVLEDCTIAPSGADGWQNCIFGHDFTLRRCNIYGGVDGIDVVPVADGVSAANVRAEGTWVHDLTYFSPFSGQSTNETHNDCIQWEGGANLTLIGCRFDGFADETKGDIATPSNDSGTTHLGGNKYYPHVWIATGGPMMRAEGARATNTGLDVQRCWFLGGSVAFNVSADPNQMLKAGEMSIRDSWFGWDFASGNTVAILAKANQQMTISGNHRMGGATPWTHGDFSVGFLRQENTIDPFDTSVNIDTLIRHAG